MATCKECLHYDICIFHIKDNENEKCPHFKISADVVEVVRCKDCAWYVSMSDVYAYKGKATMACVMDLKPTGENHYCARGVRRTKDEEQEGE